MIIVSLKLQKLHEGRPHGSRNGGGSLIQLEREGSQIFIKCNGESSRMKGTKRRSLGPVGTSQLYQMKKIGPDKKGRPFDDCYRGIVTFVTTFFVI